MDSDLDGSVDGKDDDAPCSSKVIEFIVFIVRFLYVKSLKTLKRKGKVSDAGIERAQVF